jgi:hypothetical protein
LFVTWSIRRAREGGDVSETELKPRAQAQRKEGRTGKACKIKEGQSWRRLKMRYGMTYVGGVGDQGAGLKVERWTTREEGGDELQTPFYLELDSPPYKALENARAHLSNSSITDYTTKQRAMQEKCRCEQG